MTIQDYGKLRKMLQTLSRWQRQPHQFRHSSNELHQKQMPSYKELRKILEDMTPAIVKNIASKIIAEDMNRTRLSDMKPLKAVHSLEANLAAARTKNDRDTGFKRVKVDSSKYKNWSDKINKTATKAGKKYEDVNLEADAKTVNSSEKGNGTEAPSRYATQTVLQVQTIDGSKIPKLPSFIPIADKKRKEGLKNIHKKLAPFHSHNEENASKKPESALKNIAMSDVQSNKRNFVHFVITKSDNNNKKNVIPRTKIKSTKNKTLFNETKKTGDTVSLFQGKFSFNVTNVTKENDANHANQTNFQANATVAKSSVPSEYIDEVFQTNVTPSNNMFVKNVQKNAKKNTVKDSQKLTKTINLEHKRKQHKVLHVEAKWNGQIKVKANWKEEDEPEAEAKAKKSSTVKKNKAKPKKEPAKQKPEENSGEEEGSDEYKFDDSGSRNDLVWTRNRLQKETRK